jgi:hypothetical protein
MLIYAPFMLLTVYLLGFASFNPHMKPLNSLKSRPRAAFVYRKGRGHVINCNSVISKKRHLFLSPFTKVTTSRSVDLFRLLSRYKNAGGPPTAAHIPQFPATSAV